MIKFTIDIVYCLDATGSMETYFPSIKNSIEKFYFDYQNKMKEKGKLVDSLRIKVIAYRDVFSDGDSAFLISDFYKMPEQLEQLKIFLNSIFTFGGGDKAESGLEALDIAICSDWNKTGDRQRQIIIVYTDSAAHKLEEIENFRPINYPKYISKNFDELTDKWENGFYVKNPSKRIILYSPDTYPWSEISNNWSNSVQYSSLAGKDLSESDYNEILNLISSSV